MVVFPHGQAPRVTVVPVGDPSPSVCEVVADALRETFEFPVTVRTEIEQPEGDEPDSTFIAPLTYIDHVEDAIDEEIDLAIGVTDDPIGAFDETRSMFGVGTDGGRVGVLSTAQLIADETPPDVERERLEKETRAIAGMLFGLGRHEENDRDRTGSPSCLMDRTDDRQRLDAAPPTYCEECWAALTDEETYPKPPKPEGWFVRTEAYESFETARRWARGDTTWRDYPMMALGAVVVTVSAGWNRIRPIFEHLPTDLSARDLPQPVHTIYRIVRFWGTIVLHLASIFIWLVAFLGVHDVLFGSDISGAATVVLLLVSLVFGVVSVWLLEAVALGVYAGLRGIPLEDLDLDVEVDADSDPDPGPDPNTDPDPDPDVTRNA